MGFTGNQACRIWREFNSLQPSGRVSLGVSGNLWLKPRPKLSAALPDEPKAAKRYSLFQTLVTLPLTPSLRPQPPTPSALVGAALLQLALPLLKVAPAI